MVEVAHALDELALTTVVVAVVGVHGEDERHRGVGPETQPGRPFVEPEPPWRERLVIPAELFLAVRPGELGMVAEVDLAAQLDLGELGVTLLGEQVDEGDLARVEALARGIGGADGQIDGENRVDLAVLRLAGGGEDEGEGDEDDAHGRLRWG